MATFTFRGMKVKEQRKKKRVLTPGQLQLRSFRRERKKPYMSGRWHTLKPTPGRTEFRLRDEVLFKPDNLRCVIDDRLDTCKPGVYLYRLRANPSNHTFSSFGGDLLLLHRFKPRLELRRAKQLLESLAAAKKAAAKAIKKAQAAAKKAVPVAPAPKPEDAAKATVEAPKPVIARLTWWKGDWDWNPDDPNSTAWVYAEFTSAAEAEREFWHLIEVRRIKPELVCIEWFETPKEKKGDKGNRAVQRGPTKGVHRGKRRKGGRPVRSHKKQRKANPHPRVSRRRNARGLGKGRKAQPRNQGKQVKRQSTKRKKGK